MRSVALVLAVCVGFLLSSVSLTPLASDWEDSSSSWDDVSSEWSESDLDDSDSGESDWGYSNEGYEAWDEYWDDEDAVTTDAQEYAVRIAVDQAGEIPRYPGSVVSDDAEDTAGEDLGGAAACLILDTEDSVVRVAGYYQWQLGVIPIEVRPYQFVVQLESEATGLFTSILIRPRLSEIDASLPYSSVEGLGSRIEVVVSDTPHESLSMAVERLDPLAESASGSLDASHAMSEEIDPNALMSMMLMMMTMMGDQGQTGNMDQMLQMMGSGEIGGTVGGDSGFSGEFSMDTEGQIGGELNFTSDSVDASWDVWGSDEDTWVSDDSWEQGYDDSWDDEDSWDDDDSWDDEGYVEDLTWDSGDEW